MKIIFTLIIVMAFIELVRSYQYDNKLSIITFFIMIIAFIGICSRNPTNKNKGDNNE